MIATIPNLWPAFKMDAVSPETILNRQVGYLRKNLDGYVDAEITKLSGSEDFVIYKLNLVATKT